MIYLALDQASNVTGWSVWEDKQLTGYGKVAMEGEFVDRVNLVKNFMIDKYVELSKKDKVEVVLEDIQLQQNVDTFKKLAQLLGVLECALAELNVTYHVVYSSEWKAYNKITGKNRTEQKRNAQQFVLTNYGHKVTQDEADAICIGKFISHSRMSW